MLTLQPLTGEDIETVSKIEAACFSMPWSAKALAQVLEDPHSLYVTAKEDGVIVGFCGVTDICGDGEINNVAVSEEYRGKGIAQAMLSYLCQKGEERGIVNFTLEVRAGNQAAIHVYEKSGFVSVGLRPGFYDRPKEDAMIMWRYGDKKVAQAFENGSGQ